MLDVIVKILNMTALLVKVMQHSCHSLCTSRDLKRCASVVLVSNFNGHFKNYVPYFNCLLLVIFHSESFWYSVYCNMTRKVTIT